jgi:hypothetical protein
LVLRGQPVANGDGTWYKAYVGVHDGMQIGCDLNVRYPSNALEVSGSVMIYSGSLLMPKRTSTYISAQHMIPTVGRSILPTAGASYEGMFYRSGGAGSHKTYLFVCMQNTAGGWEWVQVAVTS